MGGEGASVTARRSKHSFKLKGNAYLVSIFPNNNNVQNKNGLRISNWFIFLLYCRQVKRKSPFYSMDLNGFVQTGLISPLQKKIHINRLKSNISTLLIHLQHLEQNCENTPLQLLQNVYVDGLSPRAEEKYTTTTLQSGMKGRRGRCCAWAKRPNELRTPNNSKKLM